MSYELRKGTLRLFGEIGEIGEVGEIVKENLARRSVFRCVELEAGVHACNNTKEYKLPVSKAKALRLRRAGFHCHTLSPTSPISSTSPTSPTSPISPIII
jgi:hypothetical protein